MDRHPYLRSEGPAAFAHRGGARHAPENTMGAFESAYAMGYRYLETDAHLTADGVVVAFHDLVLDRVTDRSGRIDRLTLETVQEATVEGSGRIPTVAELLERFPDARFNIDAKSDAVVEPLIRLFEELDAFARVCIGSFSGRRLVRARSLAGGRLCTSAGPAGVTLQMLRSGRLRIRRTRADALQVPVRARGVPIVTQRLVDAAHRDGLSVHVWTVDDPEEMHRLLDLGVDGIMTDEPLTLKTVLVDRGEWTDPS